MNVLNYLKTRKYKNSKLCYNIKSLWGYTLPNIYFHAHLKDYLAKLTSYDQEYILKRVNYYNKLEDLYETNNSFILLQDFLLGKGYTPHSCFFDMYEYTRYFPKSNKVSFVFGDVTEIPDFPRIVKSRPINGNNKNSVILKLNKLRHFLFINDPKPYKNKKDMLIGRGVIYQEHRIRFFKQYFGHPMCNLGKIKSPFANSTHPEWFVEYTPMVEQLDYKFILCLEGNDVATNLKWVMSSNSLAVMPRPKYETWFMEGTLIPDYHYVEIKSDYSDLEEKLNYYIDNPDKALAIIENAHKYIEDFKNEEREDLISLLVLQKYFELQKH